MRREGWLTLGLVLALATAASPARASEKTPTLGIGPAYDALGRMAVLHQGRHKPIDTMARQMLKQVYGNETLTLFDDEGKPSVKWGHVGALLDMTVRPEFWDDQDIILVDYIPLRALLLSEPAKKQLNAVAEKPSTSAADKSKLQELAKVSTLNGDQVLEAVRETKLPEDDRRALTALAVKMKGGSGHRWMSPQDLENAQVTVEGNAVPFNMWLADIAGRMESEGMGMGRKTSLPEIEKKAYDAGVALSHYKAIRGDRVRGVELDMVIPRPSNAAYLKFSADVQKKIIDSAQEGAARGSDRLTPMENDAAQVLAKYLTDLQKEDWKVPGTDKAFDARFTGWLRGKSQWVPLKVILKSEPDELERAGFPSRQLAEFRSAYKALEDAEAASPGKVAQSATLGLVDAARGLGDSVGDYPSPAEMGRETHFNAFAPFYKAAWAYGLGLVFLLLGLGITAEKRSAVGLLARGLRTLGMIAFVSGILLEVYGFYFRVRISGWAPVTNMYETVIWVALVVAVLGLVLELIYKRTYTALAGSGVAFLATLLAYKVSLLDPNIRSLTPVLRSNYWLSIHVLTEVSSYAAFALAMGLGLIGTILYLTATYRRSVTFRELAAPLVPGLPLLVLGAFGIAASYRGWGPGMLTPDVVFYSASSMAGVGGVLAIMALGGVIGEAVSRLRFREDTVSVAEEAQAELTPAATSVQTVNVSESSGAVATLSRPTVAEIRARAASTRPKLDARALAMQATAAQIKPLANYIYRTIQVGVLLIAAGTILGGLWADVSWGRFWGWDPKEVWALITLLIYLIPLHGRFAGWVNTFGLVGASVVCFLSVVMAWYGVNFYLGVGLHSYGFTDGEGQGIVLATCIAVVAVVAAAAWRRGLANRVAS